MWCDLNKCGGGVIQDCSEWIFLYDMGGGHDELIQGGGHRSLPLLSSLKQKARVSAMATLSELSSRSMQQQ